MRVHGADKVNIPMTGGAAVVEERVGVVDGLGEGEALVVLARGESGSVGGLVAGAELAGLRDGVVVPSPDPVEGVTDGRVHREGNVAENTLGRGDDDRVRCTSTGCVSSGGGRRSVGGRGSTEGSNAFYIEKR